MISAKVVVKKTGEKDVTEIDTLKAELQKKQARIDELE
jgi:hypothetical protein